jgi:hypothetical protein
MTAGQTEAQMDPTGANSQAVFAAIGAWSDSADHIQMRIGHHDTLSFPPLSSAASIEPLGYMGDYIRTRRDERKTCG